MTAKTGAQRQASLKARRKAAGLVEVKVWVHPDWLRIVKANEKHQRQPFTTDDRLQEWMRRNVFTLERCRLDSA